MTPRLPVFGENIKWHRSLRNLVRFGFNKYFQTVQLRYRRWRPELDQVWIVGADKSDCLYHIYIESEKIIITIKYLAENYRINDCFLSITVPVYQEF